MPCLTCVRPPRRAQAAYQAAESFKAPSIHCADHRLNLVVQAGLKVDSIKLVVGSIREIVKKINGSPLVHNMVEEIVLEDPQAEYHDAPLDAPHRCFLQDSRF